MTNDLFSDLAVILILTTLLGLIFLALRQSLLLAYLGAGILMGPSGKSLIQFLNSSFNIHLPSFFFLNKVELIEALSVFGVVLLLFLVGLEMDIAGLRSLKKSILSICIGQLLFTFFAGYFITYPFVQSSALAALLGGVLTFSSTIVGIKILSDKKDLHSLYGKMVIGVLLAQDLVAIFALVFLNSVQTGVGFVPEDIPLIAAKFLGLAGFSVIWARYILPRFFNAIGRSQELVFLAAIANCFLLATLAHVLNISVEIGAFLAGLTLAGLPHHVQLISKIRPLRDFFLILFFVSLGLRFDAVSVSTQWPLIGIMVFFTLLLKPLIALLVVIFSGFKKRTAFMAGISLAQLSEFSLILMGLALDRNLASNSLLSAVTLTMIVSVLISTDLSYYANKIFLRVGKYLHFLEYRQPVEKVHALKQKLHNHIVLCGYGGMGENILRSIRKAKRPHIVVDINPDHIKTLIQKKTPYIFGDITDPEVLELLNLPKADVLISTTSRYEDNLFLIDYVREHNKNLVVFLDATSPAEALELYQRGADYVILTEYIGGDHTSLLLEEIYAKDVDQFMRHKKRHIDFLKKKLGLG